MKRIECWKIAYRKRQNEETILSNLKSPFRVLENSWRYWRADPFLFYYEGKTYIFAECYDRILRRGVIGCCELIENSEPQWKIVLKEPFHLSYPFVFVENNVVYMIPESYVANEIRLYRAIRFPDEWQLEQTMSTICAVDSTLLYFENNKFLLTQRFVSQGEQLVIFDVSDKFRLSNMRNAAMLNDLNCRPGGSPFSLNGKIYRPSQDCTESYGCALNIKEIRQVGRRFDEITVKKVCPEAIPLNISFCPFGIHTYNLTDLWEVIDLKSYEYDVLCPIMRVVWGIWRRIKRMLGLDGKL